MISDKHKREIAMAFGLSSFSPGGVNANYEMGSPIPTVNISIIWAVQISLGLPTTVFLAGTQRFTWSDSGENIDGQGLLYLPTILHKSSLPKPVDFAWENPLTNALATINAVPNPDASTGGYGDTGLIYSIAVCSRTVIMNYSVLGSHHDPILTYLWSVIIQTVRLLAKLYDNEHDILQILELNR